MTKTTFIHVGAGKCGSSAIQQFLSESPKLKRNNGSKLHYYALKKNCLLGPDGIERALKHSICGYINSIPSSLIPSVMHGSELSTTLKNLEYDIILSNESWLNGLANRQKCTKIIDHLSANGHRLIEVVAFVRPPVKWINSAWWQWGAWSSTVDFDTWLSNAIKSTMWNNPCRKVANLRRVAKFTLKPLSGDIIHQLANYLDLSGYDNRPFSANKSLPLEVLRLYHNFPELRPNPHSSGMDFVAIRALEKYPTSLTPSPWVLNNQQIGTIIEATRESNEAILDLMSSADQDIVLGDPAWWSSDYYHDKLEQNPFKEGVLENRKYEFLSACLLKSLKEAMEIIAKAGLL